ncbi:hypothetical protein M0805_008497 [Coniferiporia weirii]|nr:hypothetical protein M0805_008497 [Coniferiporia weirii]
MNSKDEGLPLDYPNNRSLIERLWVLVFGTLFQLLVDTISLPVLLASDKNRFRTHIDTGRTGGCRLCIYVPKNTKGEETSSKPRGVIVHLHGGGWTISRPETEAAICRYMSDNVGVIVVAPDYRKAPRYPYPHALEQNYQILSWIASGGLSSILQTSRIGKEFAPKIDSTRIGLSGGSAGSNLACSLTTLCVSRPLPNGASAAAQALLYPALNLAVPYSEKLSRVDPERVLPQWASRFFVRAYLPPPRSVSDPLVSPALASDEVLRALPPTAILTAAYDYLAHEADEFAAHLHKLGVPVRHQCFEDVGHGFDGIPTTDRHQRMLNNKARDEAWGMIVQVMRETLL